MFSINVVSLANPFTDPFILGERAGGSIKNYWRENGVHGWIDPPLKRSGQSSDAKAVRVV
jgi:hypothetical protein